MIIICPSCKKKFQIDTTLVPEEGRDLQCGSCNHVWFYIEKKEKSSTFNLNEDIVTKEINDDLQKKNIEEITANKDLKFSKKIEYIQKKIKDNSAIEETKIENKITISRFFSYLIVFIISFVAFLILVDTLKAPIISVFPSAEIILLNLFETLHDIKLFIIDLS